MRMKAVFSENPLDYRALCIQERILSPRVLRYGNEGLNFMCLSSYLSKEAPEGEEFPQRLNLLHLQYLRDDFSPQSVL